MRTPLVFLAVPCLAALLLAACGGDDAPAATPAATGANARLPGPRLFEVLAQLSAEKRFMQVDRSGAAHVEVDHGSDHRERNCQATALADFGAVSAIANGAASANIPLLTDTATALLGAPGGRARMTLYGGGGDALGAEPRAAFNRFVLALAEACKP